MINILQFVLGRSGSGKTSYVRDELKKRIALGERKLIFLVPEQNSFETEKSLLNILGERDFKFVDFLRFDRMDEFICRKIGGKSSDRLTSGGRNIFMSMAIEKVESELELYRRASNDIEMVNVMIDTLKEMKACAISNDYIESICLRLEEGTLKRKLHEIHTIFKCYQELVDDKFFDPFDDLTILLDRLKTSEILKGYTIFVDSFNGFSVQKLKILEEMIMQSNDTIITFCTDKTSDFYDKTGVFSSVDRTMERLLRDVSNKGVKILDPIILGGSLRFLNKDLKRLESNFFMRPQQSFKDNPENIFIYDASDIYDECDFVSRTIRKKIINEGYRYRDFTIIARNADEYAVRLGNTLSKYEIPYFMDEPEKVEDKTLLCAVFAAFDVIISDFESENIFRYLKTGLIGFSVDDISILENYVLLWGISGEQWKQPFDMHPEGFSSKVRDCDKETLLKIENLRREIICPLVKFQKGVSDETGDMISKALYELLEDIGMRENIRNFCGELINSEDLFRAEEQGRLWDILMKALDQVAITLKDVKVKPKRYMEFLRLVIQSDDISFIPRGLDEVTIGSIDRVKSPDCKIAFVIGAADGEFPASPSACGAFSDRERKKLVSIGMDIYDTLENMYDKERLLAYLAVSAPSEEIYVSWPSSDVSGNIKHASEIVREIRSIFPKIKIYDKYAISPEDWLWAEKPAFEICARDWDKGDLLSKSLRDYFCAKDEYKYKIEAINYAVNKKIMKISDPRKSEMLFGENLRLSASQIEKYYLCRFQYFCRFGLKAKERRTAKFNLLEYGSLVHFLLEKIFKMYPEGKIVTIGENQIKKDIESLMKIYVENYLGGWERKSFRFKYLFSRCSKAAVLLMVRLIEEFKQSMFRVADCELEISKDGDIKPLVVCLPNGKYVEIEGKVDRVDIMEIDNISYIRIVDYKTGAKKFKLSDVLYGLNMQMLLYLVAISKNGTDRYGDIVPAGILYMPAIKPYVISEDGETFETLKSKISKKFKMNGLVLDDTRVVQGMEEAAKGVFIPASIKDGKLKGEESIVSLEQIGIITKYIEAMTKNMALDLYGGNISVSPIQWDNGNACEWCPYGSVCGLEDDDRFEVECKIDKDKAIDEMKKKLGGDFCE